MVFNFDFFLLTTSDLKFERDKFKYIYRLSMKDNGVICEDRTSVSFTASHASIEWLPCCHYL